MGRYYLAANRNGWHRAVHRTDMSFDCVHAITSAEIMECASVLSAEQHANLIRQWLSGTGDAPLSDEWIPAEWLLRTWNNPAMAAV